MPLSGSTCADFGGCDDSEQKSVWYQLKFGALGKCTIFGTLFHAARSSRQPVLRVVFYRTAAGNEPVREWLKSLPRADRKAIGEDIKTAQFGWPLGMPLIRKLAAGMWEVRSHLDSGIARVIFTVDGNRMVLLHGLVKKAQRMPPSDMKTARQRLAELYQE